MSDLLVGVESGGAVFDLEALVRDSQQQWTQAGFVELVPDREPDVLGQLIIDSPGGEVLVDVFRVGDGMGVEGDDASVARFLEWLAHRPLLPAGVVAWPSQASEPLTLAPGSTAQHILDSEQ